MIYHPLLLLDQHYELFSIDQMHVSEPHVQQYELVDGELLFDSFSCEALFIRTNDLNGYVGDFLRRVEQFPKLRCLVVRGLHNEYVAVELLKALPTLEKLSVNSLSFYEPLRHDALTHLEGHISYLDAATLPKLKVLHAKWMTITDLEKLQAKYAQQLNHLGFFVMSEKLNRVSDWAMPSTIESFLLCDDPLHFMDARWRSQIREVHCDCEGLADLTTVFDRLERVVITPGRHIEYDFEALFSSPPVRPIDLSIRLAGMQNYHVNEMLETDFTQHLNSLNVDFNFLADCEELGRIACLDSAKHQLPSDDWAIEQNVRDVFDDSHLFDYLD